MKMIAWNVYVDRAYPDWLIDTVFYTSDCDAEYVRNSLINHDGYPANIIVRKAL